jgi:hypothetical protein
MEPDIDHGGFGMTPDARAAGACRGSRVAGVDRAIQIATEIAAHDVDLRRVRRISGSGCESQRKDESCESEHCDRHRSPSAAGAGFDLTVSSG